MMSSRCINLLLRDTNTQWLRFNTGIPQHGLSNEHGPICSASCVDFRLRDTRSSRSDAVIAESIRRNSQRRLPFLGLIRCRTKVCNGREETNAKHERRHHHGLAQLDRARHLGPRELAPFKQTSNGPDNEDGSRPGTITSKVWVTMEKSVDDAIGSPPTT